VWQPHTKRLQIEAVNINSLFVNERSTAVIHILFETILLFLKNARSSFIFLQTSIINCCWAGPYLGFGVWQWIWALLFGGVVDSDIYLIVAHDMFNSSCQNDNCWMINIKETCL